MPVFIITDNSGNQTQVVAGTLSEARQRAAAGLLQPAASLSIRQVAGDEGDVSSALIAQGIRPLTQAPLPEVTVRGDNGVNTTVRVNPITQQQQFVRPDSPFQARQDRQRTQRGLDAPSTRRIGPSARVTEEVSGPDVPAGVPTPPNITGITDSGGITFGPTGRSVTSAAPAPVVPGAGSKTLFQFTRADGATITIRAATEAEARQIGVSRGDFGPNDLVELVAIGTDSSGAPSGLVSDSSGSTPGESPRGSLSGQGTGVGFSGVNSAFNPDGDIRSITGEDIQAFPFGSFANALTSRGFGGVRGPEGVLGSSFRQAFNPLAIGGQIGSFTGTIDPIGNAPGALQAFFNQNLGRGGALSQDVFSALRGGATAPGLSSEDSAILDALRNPDIATSEGRSAATNVFDLARSAARNRFGGFASSLLPSNSTLFTRFSQPLAAGQQPDFLTFAARQFGV